mgnify:CR=1 FL=1
MDCAAGVAEIKRAYHGLCREHHPDKGDSAERSARRWMRAAGTKSRGICAAVERNMQAL